MLKKLKATCKSSHSGEHAHVLTYSTWSSRSTSSLAGDHLHTVCWRSRGEVLIVCAIKNSLSAIAWAQARRSIHWLSTH